MGQIELGWGLQVILWLQSWNIAWVEEIAKLFHYAGSEQFFLLVVPVIYWCIDASFGRRLMFLFVVNNWLNHWLKEWFHRPRPYQVSARVHKIVDETGYGIPSNHTQTATVLGGIVALKARRHWVTAAAIFYILLMGLSRMILGVHFPQDVISGLVIGLVLLTLYAWWEPRLSNWLNKQSMGIQLAVLLGAAVSMWVIHPVFFTSTSPDGLDMAVTNITVFVGGGLGFMLETRYVRFSVDGLPWKRSARTLIGLAVLSGLYLGLKMLFNGLEPEIGFRVLRYGLIILWASLGAPWVFVKLRLAEVQAKRS